MACHSVSLECCKWYLGLTISLASPYSHCRKNPQVLAIASTFMLHHPSSFVFTFLLSSKTLPSRRLTILVLRHSGIWTMAMMDMAAARLSAVLLKGDWRQRYWMEILDDEIGTIA